MSHPSTSARARFPFRQPPRNKPIDVIELLEHRRLLAIDTSAPLLASHSPKPVVTDLVVNRNPQQVINKRLPGVAAAMSGTTRTKVTLTPLPTATATATPADIATAEPVALTTPVPSGALSGKYVFTSGGHGWQWNSTLGRYATDRGDNQEIVEDFGNQEQMTAYADYLLRAGATVIPMRPVGRQINEVVLDNDSPGVTFTGTWSNSSSARYYDEDYGAVADTVPYRFASTTTGAESALATYTPNIPAAGFYPVYTWVLRGTDRVSQLYRVNHSGGSAEIRVNHSKVGSGWVYLGTYHFDAGSSPTRGSVQISNNVATAGGVIIADTIRFGNGMGDYTDSGAPGPSGYPREDENSFKWIVRSLGVGTTISTSIGTTSNVSAPSEMAEYMFAGTFGEAVYVGIHSNAGGGRGAVGLIDADTVDRTPNQSNLALFLGRQINQDMQALNGVFEHNWDPRTTHTFTGEFGEIDLGASAEMDATIIEIAFHDSALDAQLMRDPKVRDQLGRSLLQGTIEYFQNHGGLTNTISLPTAPTTPRAVSSASGQITVNWAAGPSTPTSVYGAPATGYRIYTSTNGYGFDLAATITGGTATSATLTGLDPSVPIYIRVSATNAGGESSPSEVMTALPSGGEKQVLIVNGFDRFDRTQNFRYAYAYTGDGLVDRVWPRYNNSFDYVVNVHSAIHAARPGTRVASTSNEAVISGAVNLNDYDSVIWILGNESTANRTFDSVEQAKVEQFIAAGGHVFISGSEVGWDLDQQNNGRAFYESTLLANYVADDANTYTAAAATGGIFAGLSSLVFSSGPTSTGANAFSNRVAQMYNVSTPDVLAPQPGAVTALTYSGGTGGAAGIQVTGTGGRGNVVLFGFPFETLTDATRRQQVIGRILDFFATLPTPTPGAPDLLASSDTGVSIADNLTRLTNSLQFSIPDVIQGAVVRLYDNGALVTEQTAPSAGTFTLTTPAGYTFSNGSHSITVTQTVTGFEASGFSDALVIQIDTVAPTLTIAPVPTPVVQVPSIGLTTSEPVANLAASAFSLARDNAPVSLHAVTLSGSGTTYSLDNTLDATTRAGRYVLSFADPNVTDAAGNPLAAVLPASWLNTTITVTSPTTVSRNASDPAALDVTTDGVTYTFSLTNLPSFTLAGGPFTLTTDLGNLPVLLASNTEVTFATTQRLASLSVPANSTVDLLDNDLTLATADPSVIRQYLSGGQLFSSTALTNPAQNTTLGYATFADLGLGSGSATSLLLKYTYFGDTDLDGRVTLDDLARTDRGLLLSRTTWLHGDSDHDGIIDASDLSRAHHAFSTQTITL